MQKGLLATILSADTQTSVAEKIQLYDEARQLQNSEH